MAGDHDTSMAEALPAYQNGLGTLFRPEDDKDTWVQCDACKKWRRILNSIAESLSDESPWYCSDNPNLLFNSCAVPQEMSDVEIDAGSGGGLSEDEDGDAKRDFTSPKSLQVALKRRKRPAVWQLIPDNVFTHRRRKKQHEDDIMMCQCHNWDKCGPDCLNRLLNIECVEEYCPCAHKCTNQLFTKRQYANIEVRRAGKKGFGLFTKSDIKEGDFIIEYIGEVLEEEEYLRRKDLYMATGSRHYYFMNVGNGEVIDAARKGNFGRFINHSCDPNCETQKWMVRGELTIGLFAIKDVPANTELTFDYNFERYGDKPLKCHCGSKLCRGFVGGVLEDDKELAVHAFEPEDASHDPVPIMLQAGQGNVQDIESILDRALTTPETKWDADLQNRVKQIAEQVGHNWEMLFGEGEGKAEEEEEEHKPVHKYVEPVAVEVKQEVGEEEAEEMQELAFRGPPKFNLKKKKKLQQQLQLRQEQQQQQQQQQQEEQQQETDSDAEDAMPDRQKTEETKVKAAAAKAGSTDLTQFALKSKHGSFFDLSAEGDSGGGSEKQAQRARMVKLRELQAKIREKKLKEQMAKERERRERLNELDDSIIKRRSALPTNGSSSNLQIARRCASSGRLGLSSMGGGGVSGRAAPRRSEVKHSLQLVAPNGKLRDKVAVVKLLRLFNLCDIGTKGGEVERAGTSSRGTELTANQHARMADLSLLLDMVLKTTNSNIQQDLIKYGVLSQLQPIILRTLAECFTVVMKKMMRVVDHLPLKSEDLLAVRSKHGCFVDVLKELLTHADLDVRDKAGAVFLKHKIPLPARREPPPPIIARRTPVPAPADRPGQGESPFSPDAGSTGVAAEPEVREGYAPPREWPPLDEETLTPPEPPLESGTRLGQVLTYASGWMHPRPPTVIPPGLQSRKPEPLASSSGRPPRPGGSSLLTSPVHPGMRASSPAIESTGSPVHPIPARRPTGFSSPEPAPAISVRPPTGFSSVPPSESANGRPTAFSSSQPPGDRLTGFSGRSTGFSPAILTPSAARPSGFSPAITKVEKTSAGGKRVSGFSPALPPHRASTSAEPPAAEEKESQDLGKKSERRRKRAFTDAFEGTPIEGAPIVPSAGNTVEEVKAEPFAAEGPPMSPVSPVPPSEFSGEREMKEGGTTEAESTAGEAIEAEEEPNAEMDAEMVYAGNAGAEGGALEEEGTEKAPIREPPQVEEPMEVERLVREESKADEGGSHAQDGGKEEPKTEGAIDIAPAGERGRDEEGTQVSQHTAPVEEVTMDEEVVKAAEEGVAGNEAKPLREADAQENLKAEKVVKAEEEVTDEEPAPASGDERVRGENEPVAENAGAREEKHAAPDEVMECKPPLSPMSPTAAPICPMSPMSPMSPAVLDVPEAAPAAMATPGIVTEGVSEPPVPEADMASEAPAFENAAVVETITDVVPEANEGEKTCDGTVGKCAKESTAGKKEPEGVSVEKTAAEEAVGVSGKEGGEDLEEGQLVEATRESSGRRSNRGDKERSSRSEKDKDRKSDRKDRKSDKEKDRKKDRDKDRDREKDRKSRDKDRDKERRKDKGRSSSRARSSERDVGSVRKSSRSGWDKPVGTPSAAGWDAVRGALLTPPRQRGLSPPVQRPRLRGLSPPGPGLMPWDRPGAGGPGRGALGGRGWGPSGRGGPGPGFNGPPGGWDRPGGPGPGFRGGLGWADRGRGRWGRGMPERGGFRGGPMPGRGPAPGMWERGEGPGPGVTPQYARYSASGGRGPGWMGPESGFGAHGAATASGFSAGQRPEWRGAEGNGGDHPITPAPGVGGGYAVLPQHSPFTPMETQLAGQRSLYAASPAYGEGQAGYGAAPGGVDGAGGSGYLHPVASSSALDTQMEDAYGAQSGGAMESALSAYGSPPAGAAMPIYPSEWEAPTAEFEAFVSDVVKHRIGKYEQPEHPNRIAHEEGAALYRKIRREIIAKEHEAYAERQKQNLFKPILKSKLEQRVKDFVRESIKRLHLNK